MKHKCLISVILSLLFFQILHATQFDTFRLDKITASDGLPSSSVSGILQDEMGFMWFGTQSGLVRYDGYSFKIYLHEPFDSNSLPHNLIQTMYMDHDFKLWLGTYNGLSCLDLMTDTFTNYPNAPEEEVETEETDESEEPADEIIEVDYLSDEVVVAIERDDQGRLWVGTLKGLNLYNEETNTFIHFFHDEEDPHSLLHNTVRSIFNDKKGNLWIGTYGGLSLWDNENMNFVNFSPEEDNPESIPSVYVMDIKQSPRSDNMILLGFWGGGVAEFNTVTHSAIRYEIPDMRVYKLLVDSDDSVWAGTWGGGLTIFRENLSIQKHYSKGAEHSLSHNIIYSLFQDQSGIVWIGTNGGGINKYVDWKNQYNFYTNDPEDNFTIPSGKIIASVEDKNKNIWFGFQGNGISRLNPETGIFKHYVNVKEDERSLSNDLVNAVMKDSEDNLWVATNDGLNLYVEETDDFERIYPKTKDASLPEKMVYSLAEDLDGNLWLGSYTEGLTVLETNGTYRFYSSDSQNKDSLSDNLIRGLYVDSHGIVWICTNKGLNRYLPDSDSFQRYIHDIADRTTISSNDVRRVFEDSDGDLWITTNGGGVNLYNREEDNFSLLTVDDGLLSNSVLGAMEDENGRVFFITNAGVSVYNKYESSFSIIDVNNGLLSNELTSGYLKSEDGGYYISGLGGVTYIPDFEEVEANYTPKINFNNLLVAGIPYVGESPIWATDEVNLDYNENILAFEFTLSDYSSESNNHFAYKMEGVDDDWVYSGVRNYARYVDINPGNYEFKVIGADSRNNWNIIGSSLKITIRPPFWRSQFAYITYFVVLILLILLVIFRVKRKQEETFKKIEEQKLLNQELENRVRKRTAQIEEARKIAEEATKAKSLFLANISHELRTPLNAVVGFSELLNLNEFSEEKQHIIKSIKTAGKSLSTLINDLLDLSKMEAGKMVLKIGNVQLSRVLFEIKHIFELRMNEKNLDFQLEIDDRIPNDLMLDETRIRQVLINLIGNSIKFTDKGKIGIYVKLLQWNPDRSLDFEMTVEDTGKGISDDEKERIFDLFWQSDSFDLNKPTGTGLGLSICRNLVELMNGSMNVQSTVGKGTSINIVLRNVSVPMQKRTERKKSTVAKKLEFENVCVLIADDIADNRDLLMEIMKQMNIQGIAASNGQEAVELAIENKPDMVFMDLQMPVKDGYKAAEEIASIESLRKTPIVAVTASINSNLSTYFSDFITKPYSINNIKDVLEKYMPEKIKEQSENPIIANVIKSDDSSEIFHRDELIKKLKDLEEEWMGLKPSGRMSRLESFARKLMDLGTRHHSALIKDYGQTLEARTKVFDLKGIEKELKRFPRIVDSIK